jgi:hypothetical protein
MQLVNDLPTATNNQNFFAFGNGSRSHVGGNDALPTARRHYAYYGTTTASKGRRDSLLEYHLTWPKDEHTQLRVRGLALWSFGVSTACSTDIP